MSQGNRILIIESDTLLCQSLRVVLSQKGAEVHTAFDGEEGMRKFHQVHPDLALIDAKMPFSSGLAICQQIRLAAKTPLILLVNPTIDLDLASVRRLGASAAISKPFGYDVLTDYLANFLYDSKQRHLYRNANTQWNRQHEMCRMMKVPVNLVQWIRRPRLFL